jgi:hypothetical protein
MDMVLIDERVKPKEELLGELLLDDSSNVKVVIDEEDKSHKEEKDINKNKTKGN